MLTTIYLHQCDFNPRSPCGERRGPRQLLAVTMGFQSTLPLRGATALERQPFSGYTISIHAPLAGSDYQAVWSLDGYVISIHAPLAGSDRCLGPQTPGSRYFNPRSPCGERRHQNDRDGRNGDFNPRSPCGERPGFSCIASAPSRFQSTLPLRGATFSILHYINTAIISIHAPLAGSDTW